MNGYVQLLRHNVNFARLWLAQAISLLGDWFSTIALSTLVSHYTNGSGLAVSALLLARFLPPLIVGPFAGVLVDRLNRKRLLIFSDVLRALIVCSFLLVTDASRLWLIYALTVLQFSLSALFEPGRSAILPNLVATDDLVKANLLGSVTWSVMLAAGAAIGGLVAATLGTPTALLIDSSSFLLSALFIASIRWTPPIRTTNTERSPDRAVRRAEAAEAQLGFVDGLRYVMKHPATAAALLIKLGGSIGSLDALLILYATKLFVLGENGTGSLGIAYAAFGVGAVLGPLALERFNNGSVRAMRRLIIVGYACISVGWLLFSGAPSLLFLALAMLVKAMGSSVYWTYSSVIIQKVVPEKFLGRLFSLDLAGFQLATVISTIITGGVVEQVGIGGVRGVALASGLLSLLPLVLWVLALPWIERKDGSAASLTAPPAPIH